MMSLKVNVSPYAVSFGKKALRQALRVAGRAVSAKAKSLIGPKGGSPSKPGAAPNSVTGTLKKSFKVQMGRLSVQVIDIARSTDDADTFYARFLETGAHGGGRKGANTRVRRGNQRITTKQTSTREMLPRPFLTTAVTALAASIQASITKAVMDDIRGVTPRKGK